MGRGGRLGLRRLPKILTEPSTERVQQELDEVLGASQAISYEDRERLPYTRAVLHEVQRLSSVVAVGAVRQCVTSTWIHGYYVPKVSSLQWAQHLQKARLPSTITCYSFCYPDNWQSLGHG